MNRPTALVTCERSGSAAKWNELVEDATNEARAESSRRMIQRRMDTQTAWNEGPLMQYLEHGEPLDAVEFKSYEKATSDLRVLRQIGGIEGVEPEGK